MMATLTCEMLWVTGLNQHSLQPDLTTKILFHTRLNNPTYLPDLTIYGMVFES